MFGEIAHLVDHLHPLRDILHQRHDGYHASQIVGQRRVKPFAVNDCVIVAGVSSFDPIIRPVALPQPCKRLPQLIVG